MVPEGRVSTGRTYFGFCFFIFRAAIAAITPFHFNDRVDQLFRRSLGLAAEPVWVKTAFDTFASSASCENT
jgi:hypothetical protein